MQNAHITVAQLRFPFKNIDEVNSEKHVCTMHTFANTIIPYSHILFLSIYCTVFKNRHTLKFQCVKKHPNSSAKPAYCIYISMLVTSLGVGFCCNYYKAQVYINGHAYMCAHPNLSRAAKAHRKAKRTPNIFSTYVNILPMSFHRLNLHKL